MFAEPRVAATPARTTIPARVAMIRRTFRPTNWLYSSFSLELSIAASVDIVSASLINLIEFKFY